MSSHAEAIPFAVGREHDAALERALRRISRLSGVTGASTAVDDDGLLAKIDLRYEDAVEHRVDECLADTDLEKTNARVVCTDPVLLQLTVRP